MCFVGDFFVVVLWFSLSLSSTKQNDDQNAPNSIKTPETLRNKPRRLRLDGIAPMNEVYRRDRLPLSLLNLVAMSSFSFSLVKKLPHGFHR